MSAPSRDAVGREPSGRETRGRDSAGGESHRPDAAGGESRRPDTAGREGSARDHTGRATSDSEASPGHRRGIRSARVEDVPTILTLIRDLATYEREPDAVKATEDGLRKALFGPQPAVFAHMAEDDNGHVVGFALWFRTFSTWEGVHGIYLEDLYVRPEARGAGYGKALLRELARIAVTHGYARVEWAVLNWNAPSIAFYDSLGARPQDEWTTYRLTGAALAELGGRD